MDNKIEGKNMRHRKTFTVCILSLVLVPLFVALSYAALTLGMLVANNTSLIMAQILANADGEKLVLGSALGITTVVATIIFFTRVRS